MIVVSDASPIVALAAVDQLELLRQLYGEVVVPEAVRAELQAGPTGPATLRTTPWIRAEAIRDHLAASDLQEELDRGEAQAIVLAIELRADLLLIDERRGRAVAKRRGIQVTGLVGVLLEAKRASLIGAVRPLLDALVERAGFFLHPGIYERALEEAGEQGAPR